jgi:hypothetical protein
MGRTFEYQKLTNPEIEKLNELGGMGWEVCAVWTSPNWEKRQVDEHYLLKRTCSN